MNHNEPRPHEPIPLDLPHGRESPNGFEIYDVENPDAWIESDVTLPVGYNE